MIGLFRVWLTNRPLLYALMRFAGLLIQAVQAHGDGGKYITSTEWDKAQAAARAAYEEAAQRAGWKPVKTVAEILKARQ